MAVSGNLGSLPDWAAASYDPLTCFKSPFTSFDSLRSQNGLSSSSKAGVLSSSMEAMLGRLNDLLLGVEQEGSSNCQDKKVENSVMKWRFFMGKFIIVLYKSAWKTSPSPLKDDQQIPVHIYELTMTNEQRRDNLFFKHSIYLLKEQRKLKQILLISSQHVFP